MSIERTKAAIAAAAGEAEEWAGLAQSAGKPIDAAADRIAATTRGTSHHLPGEAIAGLREAKSVADEGLWLLAAGLRNARQYAESGL